MFIVCKVAVRSIPIGCLLSWDKTIIETSINAQIFISSLLFIFKVIYALDKRRSFA